MKLFALSASFDLLGIVFFGVWLWVLLRRRDLWLRYTAKEAATYSRLHFPQWFINACRKFEEGRGFLYFAVAGLVICSLFLVLSSAMYIHIARTKSSSPDRSLRVTVTMDTNGVPWLAGVPLSNTNIRDRAFAALRAMGLRGTLAVPPLTNGDPQIANAIDTLETMRRAGLFGSGTNYSPSMKRAGSSGGGTNYSPSTFE